LTIFDIGDYYLLTMIEVDPNYLKEIVMKFQTLKNLLNDESGATAIEYGLIAALVSVAAITALTAMGASLNTMFTAVSTALTGATATAP
jgi:pilus assembly protein Flp/PilA